jgi:hypothetical protein
MILIVEITFSNVATLKGDLRCFPFPCFMTDFAMLQYYYLRCCSTYFSIVAIHNFRCCSTYFSMLHYIVLSCYSIYISMLHYIVYIICDVAFESVSCSWDKDAVGTGARWRQGPRCVGGTGRAQVVWDWPPNFCGSLVLFFN